jgi:hypothetical protein
VLAQLRLAEALRATGGDRERARSLARAARDGLGALRRANALLADL